MKEQKQQIAPQPETPKAVDSEELKRVLEFGYTSGIKEWVGNLVVGEWYEAPDEFQRNSVISAGKRLGFRISTRTLDTKLYVKKY